MFTTRPVTKGEELLYNYGVCRWTAPPKRMDPDADVLAQRTENSCKLCE